VSVKASYLRVVGRKGRTLTLTRKRSLPKGETFDFIAASRDFRTNHPEVLLGSMHQDRQEFWCRDTEFAGVNAPKENDWVTDGQFEYTILEVSQLFDGPGIVGYRFVCMGDNGNPS